MDIFRTLTLISYWLLIFMWTGLLIFFIRRLINRKIQGIVFFTLLVILSIDAFRTLFENLYFGVWYTFGRELVSKGYHEPFIQPQYLFLPKVVHIVTACLVIFILIRHYIPQEAKEKDRQQRQLEELEEQILERANVEKALRFSQERYRNLFETAIVALFRIQTADGRITNPNRMGAKLLGYDSANELIKDYCTANDFLSDDKIKELLDRLKKGNGMADLETRCRFKDGREADLLMSARNYPMGGYIECAAIDISDRKIAEQAMLKSEQLKTSIEMAGAICHEMSQPTQNILGYTDLVLMRINKQDPSYETMLAIKKQIQRMTRITRKLKNITSYETKDYVGGVRIVDIDRSTREQQE